MNHAKLDVSRNGLYHFITDTSSNGTWFSRFLKGREITTRLLHSSKDDQGTQYKYQIFDGENLKFANVATRYEILEPWRSSMGVGLLYAAEEEEDVMVGPERTKGRDLGFLTLSVQQTAPLSATKLVDDSQEGRAAPPAQQRNSVGASAGAKLGSVQVPDSIVGRHEADSVEHAAGSNPVVYLAGEEEVDADLLAEDRRDASPVHSSSEIALPNGGSLENPGSLENVGGVAPSVDGAAPMDVEQEDPLPSSQPHDQDLSPPGAQSALDPELVQIQAGPQQEAPEAFPSMVPAEKNALERMFEDDAPSDQPAEQPIASPPEESHRVAAADERAAASDAVGQGKQPAAQNREAPMDLAEEVDAALPPESFPPSSPPKATRKQKKKKTVVESSDDEPPAAQAKEAPMEIVEEHAAALQPIESPPSSPPRQTRKPKKKATASEAKTERKGGKARVPAGADAEGEVDEITAPATESGPSRAVSEEPAEGVAPVVKGKSVQKSSAKGKKVAEIPRVEAPDLSSEQDELSAAIPAPLVRPLGVKTGAAEPVNAAEPRSDASDELDFGKKRKNARPSTTYAGKQKQRTSPRKPAKGRSTEAQAAATSVGSSSPVHDEPPLAGDKAEKPAKRLKKAAAAEPSPAKPKDENVVVAPNLEGRSLPKVMFTGIEDGGQPKVVDDLGGEVVESWRECTHVVTESKVKRTVKFLCALATGKQIVSTSWLEACKRASTFVDESKFVIRDKDAEKKWGFSLIDSIKMARNSRVLAGKSFYVTAHNLALKLTDLKEIIEAAGGKVLDDIPDLEMEDKSSTFILGCQDDEAFCKELLKQGFPVQTNEFVLTGILRQRLERDEFKLDTSRGPEADQVSPKGSKRKR
ncbi:hypothetical protein DFJ74DRAFT_684492 [Hyaloraphidium curvatum]|nr:hypothetical protein DFJ74DRAFT_684492 [Hyaloraphidium curvatum]